MWLAAVVLALGALAIRAFIALYGRIAVQPDFGWMSEHWLAEHRASSR